MRNGYISLLRRLIKMSYPLTRKFCICQLRKCRQRDSCGLQTAAAIERTNERTNADRQVVVRMILAIKKIHAPSNGDMNFPSFQLRNSTQQNIPAQDFRNFRVLHANPIMVHSGGEKMRGSLNEYADATLNRCCIMFLNLTDICRICDPTPPKATGSVR